MDTWAVLLRGINVGGKRVIAMRDLRDAFERMGFIDPVTYIQSGNVVVGSARRKTARIVSSIERDLSDGFGHDVRVVVRDLEEMTRIVRGIPRDWDPLDRSVRHNVIFFTDAVDPRAVLASVDPKPGLESVKAGPNVLYWSAPLATITRTAMLRLNADPVYKEATIRNPRVTRRLLELMRERTAG